MQLELNSPSSGILGRKNKCRELKEDPGADKIDVRWVEKSSSSEVNRPIKTLALLRAGGAVTFELNFLLCKMTLLQLLRVLCTKALTRQRL